jgi:hypothetical protein
MSESRRGPGGATKTQSREENHGAIGSRIQRQFDQQIGKPLQNGSSKMADRMRAPTDRERVGL